MIRIFYPILFSKYSVTIDKKILEIARKYWGQVD